MSKARVTMLLLLMAALVALSGCGQNPPESQLYGKLLSAFEAQGYTCTLEDTPEGTPVGIYNASVWKSLVLGGESVLVYFDESNRADYLLTLIDHDAFPIAVNVGQRFILTYTGTDEALSDFIKDL